MNSLIPAKRPFGLKLIITALLLLPLALLFVRFPPPILALSLLGCVLLAYGIARYNRYAYWVLMILMLFGLSIGVGVTIVTLWISHPEGYPESLPFVSLLTVLIVAVWYLAKSPIRSLFLGYRP